MEMQKSSGNFLGSWVSTRFNHGFKHEPASMGTLMQRFRCRKPTMNVDHFPTKNLFCVPHRFVRLPQGTLHGFPWAFIGFCKSQAARLRPMGPSNSYLDDRPRHRRQSLISGFSHLITGLCPTTTTTSNWNDPPKPNFLG